MYESNTPEIIKYLTEDDLKLMYGRLNRRFVVVDTLPAVETLNLANKNAIYVVKESIGDASRYWPYVFENNEWKILGIGRQDLDSKIDKVAAIAGHLVVANDDGSLVDANIMPGTFVALSFDPTEQIQPHATDIRKIWDAFQTGMPVILLDNRSGGTGLYASLNAAGYTWPDGNHMAERLVDVDENYRSCNDTIPGYYDSDTKKFYDDIYHSIEIDPIEDALFHDLGDDKVYLYAEGEFVRVLRFVQFSTNELMKDDPAWPSRKSARPVFFRIFEPMTSATANNFYAVYGEYTTTIKVNVDPEIMYGNGVEEPIGVYEYNGEMAGLVPDAPDSDTDKKFLRADGQWGTITIPEQVQSDWAQDGEQEVDFIKNKPNLAPVATSGSYDDLKNKPHIPADQIQADWAQDDDKEADFIKNKPELADVATSGSYNDLADKPHIPDDQIQSDWAQDNEQEADFIKNKPELADVATSGSYDDLEDKPHIPDDPVQSDWNQSATNELDYIKNKPGTFGPASAQQAGTDGFVPAPQAGDQDKYLKGDGTWATITIPVVADMTGATEQSNGAHGLVPQPLIADREKFLKGDGTWTNVDNTRACTVPEMDDWLDEVDNEGNNNG